MVDCETTIIKYDVLQLTDIERLLYEGHEMEIEYIARSGCWGSYDSENQPIKEPFGIIKMDKNNEETIIKLNPNEMVDLINLMAKRKC